MLREYHKWQSPSLNRDMELLVFGHGGARVIVFPTSMGRFYDWENRGLIKRLQHHIDSGWLQLYCVDSVDSESWYNEWADPGTRAARHLQFHDYIGNEVLPFSKSKNDSGFLISAGASFGAYHAISIALRYPHLFDRALGMSGMYDIRRWTGGQYNDAIHQSNPYELVRCMEDAQVLAHWKHIDWIMAIGQYDPCFESNDAFSRVLWEKGIWNALRVWDGNAHDWQHWEEMLLHYIGGSDGRS